MKSIKYLLICFVSIAILANCGSNDSKRVVAPDNCQALGNCPVGPIGTNNPLNPANGQVRVYQSSNLNVYNAELYNDFLKSVYGSCDIPTIVPTGNLISTILLSGLASSATRCSKFNDRAFLEITLADHQQAQIRYDIQSSYLRGSAGQNLIHQTVPLQLIKDNTALYADLNTNFAPYNFQRGVSMEIQGDINSNEFYVYLDYHGDEIANFVVHRVR